MRDSDNISQPEPAATGAEAEPTSHVCFLTSSAPLGPDSAYSPFILELAREINQRGYGVTILMPHVAGSATRETLRGVTVLRYRYLPFASAETLGLGGGMLPGLRERKLDLLKVPFLLRGQYRALRRLHAERPIDVLHSHWLIPQGVVGGRFSAARELCHVATAHGSDILGLRFPGARAALRYALRRSQVVTVNSLAMKEELQRRVGQCEVLVVHIGARMPEPDAVEDNLKLRGSLPTCDYVLGFVGRVIEEKGALEFVRTLATIRSQGDSVVGLVVGTGNAETAARELAEELGVGGAIRFVGSVAPEQVPRYMSVMDVLVVPSHYEAQGLVAIEAMLLALPVVAFETGGLRETVVHGETGLTVEPGDVQGLARSVRRLFDDSALRERLALGARQRALGRFTLAAAADRFVQIYDQLLTDGGREQARTSP